MYPLVMTVCIGAMLMALFLAVREDQVSDNDRQA